MVREGRAKAYLNGLLERYRESPEFCGSGFLSMLFDFALDYEGASPAETTPSILRTVLLELFPRKVCCEPEEAKDIVAEVRAFFRFAQRRWNHRRSGPCLKLLTPKLIDRLEFRLGDTRRFGMAKSLFTAGCEAGFDMESEEGLQEAVAALNAQPRGGQDWSRWLGESRATWASSRVELGGDPSEPWTLWRKPATQAQSGRRNADSTSGSSIASIDLNSLIGI